jgi:hypothetical protein
VVALMLKVTNGPRFEFFMNNNIYLLLSCPTCRSTGTPEQPASLRGRAIAGARLSLKGPGSIFKLYSVQH